jgi:hypothetical protein
MNETYDAAVSFARGRKKSLSAAAAASGMDYV